MNRLSSAALAGAVVLGLAGAVSPASAASPASDRGGTCVDVHDDHGGAAAARGGSERAADHREMTAEEEVAVEQRTDAILAAEGAPDQAQVTIPVYFHVMMDRAGNGDVTDGQIAAQVAKLNQTYAGGESNTATNTGFTFQHAGTDRFHNNRWHQDKDTHQYRRQTRIGGPESLNIWLVEFDYLGIATFPWDYADKYKVDGVRLLWASLPGGTETNYNEGDTATHEVGHWLGLYHTFDGGCKNRRGGDEIDDTPVQAAPTNGCPVGADTCPEPGLDPIHNYMDYSYDACYTEFTPDQSTRMSEMWEAYRV